MKARLVVALIIAALAVSGSAFAQCRGDWSGNVAVNYTNPTGATGDALGGGASFTAGVTYQPIKWPVGVLLELSHTNFSAPNVPVETETPGQSAYLYGKAQLWSLTANAIWSREVDDKLGYYTVGGVGAYRRKLALSTHGGFDSISWCNPWSGECSIGLVPVSSVVGTQTETKFGYNLGVGVTYWIGCTTQLYLEARYHWANTSKSMQFIPVSFGIRF